MKAIPPLLFNELRSQTPRIATAWLLVRTDGQRFAFTTSDLTFVYNGDTYTPANGFNPSAIVSKGDASVDNLECQVLTSDTITEEDLKGGVWNLATVQIFWICPYHPEWGICTLRTGTLGEIVIKEGQFTTQLRALFEQLQLPFGAWYTINCGAQLGDPRCKVKLAAPTWQPNTAYPLGLLTDAKWGAIVQPSTPNGFWYVAQYTTNLDPASRIPSYPGQGLSAQDDLGPDDQTQTAAGPSTWNLDPFAGDNPTPSAETGPDW
jgi:Uncharacterized conserved protein (DUF2163)